MKHSPSQTDEKYVFPKDQTAYVLEKHLEMFNAISLLGQVILMFLHITLCYMSAMQVHIKNKAIHMLSKKTLQSLIWIGY